jgi:general secretion pathway protein E
MEIVSLSACMPLPAGNAQYPLDFMRAQEILKLSEDERQITVGSPADEMGDLAVRLKLYHRKTVNVRRIDPAEFAAYIGRLLGAEREEGAAHPYPSGHSLEALASDAPVISQLNGICIEAIRRGASDIHLEAFCRTLIVRYRIDGVLQTVQRLEASRFAALSARVKVMAGLNIMERRRPQDGRITVTLAGQAVDMRVSCIPTAAGEGTESIVLRIFNAKERLFRLEELGFRRPCLEGIRGLLGCPEGMILICGPTGSGKSTTLNAMIRSVASQRIKIITIEDPVEYVLEGIDQIQTNETIGLSFDSLLRRVLRQDPDIILMGEIRDHETAGLAVRAALTGHLVLSTLHTPDAVSSIPRLRNLGVDSYLIAAVLRGVISQRLLRQLCPACRAEPLPEGCPCCGGAGYSGRFAAAEFFRVSQAVASLIAAEAGREALAKRVRREGMIPIGKSAGESVAEGRTSLDELRRCGLAG